VSSNPTQSDDELCDRNQVTNSSPQSIQIQIENFLQTQLANRARDRLDYNDLVEIRWPYLYKCTGKL